MYNMCRVEEELRGLNSMDAYERPCEKIDRHCTWLDVCAMDLPERGLALLRLAHPALVQAILHLGKYADWYETNRAPYPAWANYMEC